MQNTIDDFDNGILFEQKNTTSAAVNNNEILKNPFFLNVVEKKLDEVTKKDLYIKYSHVYILCNREKETNNINKIYEQNLSEKELSELSTLMTLVKCEKKIIYYNKDHYNQSQLLNITHLASFNHRCYKLEKTEIIVPMFEYSEQHADVIAKLYNTTDFKDLVKIINYTTVFANNIDKSYIIANLKGSEYWENKYNCDINMSNSFNQRKFKAINDQNNDIVSNTKDQPQEIKTILDAIAKDNINKNHYELKSNKNDKFVDASEALNFGSGKRTYFPNKINYSQMNKQSFYQDIFVHLKEKDKYDVFNALLTTKEYSHLVMNNKQVLTAMKQLFSDHKAFYKCYIGYAWMCFYFEECIYKTNALNSDRYIFDLDTTALLPTFPFSFDDIHQNPYVTLLLNKETIDYENNCLAIPQISGHDYSVTNFDEFKERFNIFTTGKSNKNIFDKLKWESFAVTGSLIPACCQKHPVLLDYVCTPQDVFLQDRYSKYFNHYYETSDIDMMCNKQSVYDFMDSVQYVADIVSENIDSKVNIEPVTSMMIMITQKYINNNIQNISLWYKKDVTVIDVFSNLNNYKEYFYSVYLDLMKNKIVNNTKQNSLYEHFDKQVLLENLKLTFMNHVTKKSQMKENDCTMYVYSDDVDAELLLKVNHSIKFKLHSKQLLHSIEIFRATGADFFKVVGRFHLPCVRGYYNGSNTYLMPSCITALMTGINIDYKYFAGIRDPIDIINKYRMRGFSVIINKTERKHMLDYNKTVITPHNKMFLVNNKTELFGAKLLGNNIYNSKGPIHQPLVNKKYIMNMTDLAEEYKNYNYDVAKSVINVFKLKTINDSGCIEPLKKWLSTACY